MLRSILQNSTAGFYIFASDSTAPTSGKTGLTITATLSKAGGSANAVSPTITEIGNGLYWIAPIAAHRDTLGEIAWQFSATGAIIAPRLEKVVAVNDQTARFGASDGTGVTLAADQEVNVTKWGGTAVGSVTINCNMTQISGDSGAADNAESFFDGTGYAGTNNVIPTVTTVTNGVTVSDKTGFSLASGGLAAVTSWTVAITGNITGNLSGSVGSVTDGVTVDTNNDKTGYSLSQSFPTHFANMQIAANGHVSAVAESMANNSITASAIQGDAITAAKIAADAVTKIQSGLATQSSLNTLIQYVDTEVASIKEVTDKVDTMIEVDGLVYRYTTNALEQAPSGGGGGGGTDWTADERTAIRTILGIPGSGSTPADPSDGVLYDIKQKTDQIGSAGAITNLLAGAVLDPGTITSFPSELVIGDSYQETDGREIQIPLVDTDGNVLTTIGSRNLADATATFEIRRINESDSTRVITGVATIVDPPGTGTTTALGAPYAIVELPADETAKGLVSYRYKGKLTLTWSGPGTDVYSFDTETIKFTY